MQNWKKIICHCYFLLLSWNSLKIYITIYKPYIGFIWKFLIGDNRGDYCEDMTGKYPLDTAISSWLQNRPASGKGENVNKTGGTSVITYLRKRGKKCSRAAVRESEKNVRETTLQTLRSDCEGVEVLHVSKYQKLVYYFTKLHRFLAARFIPSCR